MCDLSELCLKNKYGYFLMLSGINLSGAEAYGNCQQGSTFIRSFLRTSDDIVPGG